MGPPEKSHIVLRPVDGRTFRRLREPLLHHLDLEITERCNFACRHCGIRRKPSDAGAIDGEMDPREIRKILADARQLGCESLTLTGGEPLVRQDFPEICTQAGDLGFRIRLFTNASLLTRDHIALIRKIAFLDTIEITLYGMQPATYGRATGNPGAFEPVLKGISLLRENRLPFLLKFAVFAWNECDVPAFRTFAQDCGVRESASFVMLFNKRVRRDSDAANQAIDALRISPGNAVRFMSAYQPDYFSDLPRFLAGTAGPQGDVLFGCGAGQGRGAVDAYGRLTPCLLLKAPEFSCDLRQVSLKEAVTGFAGFRRNTRARNPAYLERCGQCFLKSLCDQCPAVAWMETGKIDQPVEYFCRVTHAQAEHLGLIQAGERAWEAADWKARVQRLQVSASNLAPGTTADDPD